MLADLFCQLHGTDGHERLQAAVNKIGRQILVEDSMLPDLSHLLPEDEPVAGRRKPRKKKSEALIAQGWGLQGTQAAR